MKREGEQKEDVDGDRGRKGERRKDSEDQEAELDEQNNGRPVQCRRQRGGVRALQGSKFSYAERQRQVEANGKNSGAHIEIAQQNQKGGGHRGDQHAEVDVLHQSQAATAAQREGEQALPGRSAEQPQPSGATFGGALICLVARSRNFDQIGGG